MTPNHEACATCTAPTSSKPENHHATAGDEHEERHHAVPEEAALLLDTPRLIDGARHRAEYAKRCPDKRQPARDAQL